MNRHTVLAILVVAVGLTWWLTRRAEPTEEVSQGGRATVKPRPAPAASEPPIAAARTPVENPSASTARTRSNSNSDEPIARVRRTPEPALAAPSAVATKPTAGAAPTEPGTIRTGAAPAIEPAPAEATEGRNALQFSLDRDGIQGAVREQLPAIRECYEGWQEANPGLGGRLLVHFRVERATDDAGEPYGRVIEAALERSDLDHPFLEGCALNAFSDMRFDAPEGELLSVRYPVVLRGDEDSPEPQP